MYSKHNKRKTVVAERLIRILNNRTYRYMTSILKNVYIDKLEDIIIKYNNIHHRTIKKKCADIRSSTCIDLNKYPQFKVSNDVTNNIKIKII